MNNMDSFNPVGFESPINTNLDTPAGNGNLNVVPIKTGSIPISSGEAYFKVSVARWFVNKSSSFFRTRTVSGIATITFSTYDQIIPLTVVLGEYDLKDGQKTSPVFDTPIIPCRCLRSDIFGVTLDIYAVSRDTVPGRLLREAAVAGTAIAATALSTVTGGAAVLALVAAGTTLAASVGDVLKQGATTTGHYLHFADNQVKAKDLGETTYILVHRGAHLDNDKVSIIDNNGTLTVMYNNQELLDGCWVLLEVEIGKRYSGAPRPWKQRQDRFDEEIRDMMSDWNRGRLDQNQVKINLEGNMNEEYLAFRSLIRDDEVLTKVERDSQVGVIEKVYEAAKKAVEANNPAAFSINLRASAAGTVGEAAGTHIALHLWSSATERLSALADAYDAGVPH